MKKSSVVFSGDVCPKRDCYDEEGRGPVHDIATELARPPADGFRPRVKGVVAISIAVRLSVMICRATDYGLEQGGEGDRVEVHDSVL